MTVFDAAAGQAAHGVPRPPARSPLRPSSITVLYDADCPVCRRARRWAERHRQLVPVHFVPAGSSLARSRFPGLDVGSTMAEVTAITNNGAVLRGDRAWIAVLWCVARTRRLAVELAHGRHRRLFRRFRGGTDAIRELSRQRRGEGPSSSRAPAAAPLPQPGWAPPFAEPSTVTPPAPPPPSSSDRIWPAPPRHPGVPCRNCGM